MKKRTRSKKGFSKPARAEEPENATKVAENPTADDKAAPHSYHYRPMDAQEEFNELFVSRPLARQTPEQKALLLNYLPPDQGPISLDPSRANYDPIAAAMAAHPGLTREEAEEMAREFGF